MRLAVIPARGGSKRIPNKNIKAFMGKPILAYSIEAALQSGVFDRVIVSTDDAEIADIAKKYGASVPFLRPEEIANDRAVIADVMKHAVSWFESQQQPVGYACCIYATAPLLQVKDLIAGFNMVTSGETDLCLSVTTFSFPIQRALKKGFNDVLEPVNPECMPMRSQDLEPCYHDAAQFFCGTRDAFLGDGQGLTMKGYEIDRAFVQDIDTPEDWNYAEFLYQANANKH